MVSHLIIFVDINDPIGTVFSDPSPLNKRLLPTIRRLLGTAKKIVSPARGTSADKKSPRA